MRLYLSLMLIMLWQSNCFSYISDIFSSVKELKSLCHEKVKVIEDLEKYDKRLEEKIAALDWYLNYYYVDYENLTPEIAEEYVSTPVNAYRIMDRLYHVTNMTRNFSDRDAWDTFIGKNVSKLVLPETELDDAAQNILTLQVLTY